MFTIKMESGGYFDGESLKTLVKEIGTFLAENDILNTNVEFVSYYSEKRERERDLSKISNIISGYIEDYREYMNMVYEDDSYYKQDVHKYYEETRF